MSMLIVVYTAATINGISNSLVQCVHAYCNLKNEVIGHIWLSLVIGLPVVRIVYLCNSGTCSLIPSIFWSSLAPLCQVCSDATLAIGC